MWQNQLEVKPSLCSLGVVLQKGVLGLGFQSDLFRCKEFPADLVESFLSHSPGFFSS